MNRLLAFAFVLAMTAAGVFGVKWQRLITKTEADARKAAREEQVAVTPRRADPKMVQEVRRLESEIQRMRVQMANQREITAEANRRQIESLMKENDALQVLLTERLNAAPEVAAAPPPVQVEAVEPEPEEEEEANPIGITVVGMNEFRKLDWRLGTLPAVGAAVVEIEPGSPAMIAGIQIGDIVLSFGDTVIDGAGMFHQKVAELLPGSATQVTLNRDRSEVIVVLVRPLE